MRCVATRATVTHRKEPAIAAINIRNSSGSSDDCLPIRGKERVNHLVMMGRLLCHRLEQGRIHRRWILLLAVQEGIKPNQIWIFRQTHYDWPLVRQRS